MGLGFDEPGSQSAALTDNYGSAYESFRQVRGPTDVRSMLGSYVTSTQMSLKTWSEMIHVMCPLFECTRLQTTCWRVVGELGLH